MCGDDDDNDINHNGGGGGSGTDSDGFKILSQWGQIIKNVIIFSCHASPI